MKYIELAKQLKDAGFPQEELSIIVSNEDSFVKDPNHLDAYIYVPTLSELISACDIPFSLNKEPRVEGPGGDIYYCQWEAEPLEDETIYGKTPEEVVAKLWLALNEKK